MAWVPKDSDNQFICKNGGQTISVLYRYFWKYTKILVFNYFFKFYKYKCNLNYKSI